MIILKFVNNPEVQFVVLPISVGKTTPPLLKAAPKPVPGPRTKVFVLKDSPCFKYSILFSGVLVKLYPIDSQSFNKWHCSSRKSSLIESALAEKDLLVILIVFDIFGPAIEKTAFLTQ